MDEFEALLKKFEEPEDLPDEVKSTVLVVDDDDSMRRGLLRSLSASYEVATAENGKRALEEFGKQEFCAVILDVKMPGMNGFEVCKELHKLNRDVPIIFYTAFQGEHDIQAVLNIYKPFAYLDKGGAYDLFETVGNAVHQYSEINERKKYQAALENKIIELGLPVREAKELDLVSVPNIIGTKRINYTKNERMEIRDFATRELIGYMPDLTDEEIESAIEECRAKLDYWRRLTVNERLEVIAAAGKRLLETDSFDHVIPRSGWFSQKVSVKPDRVLTAKWMLQSVNYMKWAFGNQRVESDVIDGMGTVGIIIQSSMFQTGAYGIIDALRSGNSILIKLDGRDPYPEYLIGSVLADSGAPVQIISSNTLTKPHIGRKLIDALDKIVFMGNPYKVIEIAYGEAIQQIKTTGGLSSHDIDSLEKKLLIPAKVISYTAHLAGAYIHSDADVETAVKDCVYSSISHYRSCKRLKVLTVHPSVYEEVKRLLNEAYGKLKVGASTDPDADIVEASQVYWEKFIRPYLEQTRKYGGLLFGAEKPFQPKIIEIDPELLAKGNGIEGYLGTESMFPHLVLIKGDQTTAIYATKLMAQNSHDGMILEYSVFNADRDVFRFIEKYGYAFNYHLNEPTTWGLGNPDKNKFRYHQRKCLAVDLAGTRVG